MDNDEKDFLPLEDGKKRPAREIGAFIAVLIMAIILFALFSNPGLGHGTGSGKGVGSGSGTGVGTGTGSGSGAGKGAGIGKSSSDGEGGGDDSTSKTNDESAAEARGDKSSDAKAESNTLKTREKGGDEKVELPNLKWNPSSIQVGKKRIPPPKTVKKIVRVKKAGAGRGGGGGRGKPMGTGDISFRIYWTPKMHDVDLHVIDPNGHHLFFEHRECACSGQLDVDDTSNGGPENIFWPTGKCPHGKFEYFVRYYQGVGRKNVTIQVRKAGKLFKSHRVILRRENEESRHFSINY